MNTGRVGMVSPMTVCIADAPGGDALARLDCNRRVTRKVMEQQSRENGNAIRAGKS